MATQTETPIVETPDTDAILETAREQMEAQMEELRPNYEAFMRLQTIVANFDKVTTTATRKSRKDGGKTRSEEFLAMVKGSGGDGLSVAEASKKMGVNQNYLYRIAKDQSEANVITKGEDKRYRAA